MKARLAIVWALAVPLALAGSRFALAQCPQPNPYNGDEPSNFTHCIDPDANGVCQAVAEKVNGAYPNRTYPDCICPDGSQQVAHGHWEYTHLQAEVPGDTEEKDYLDTTQPPEQMLDQTARFATKEPVRFYRALSPTQNPSGHYWQVDEWIGPAGVPFLTWTERFFECSGPTNCAKVGDQDAAGGYWSTDAQPLYDAFSQPVTCGNGLEASPDPARSACCGLLFALP